MSPKSTNLPLLPDFGWSQQRRSDDNPFPLRKRRRRSILERWVRDGRNIYPLLSSCLVLCWIVNTILAEYGMRRPEASQVSLVFQVKSPLMKQDIAHPKILFFTMIFGEEAMNKRLLRLFVESARRSGVDIALVGFPAPPFELPPNVMYLPCSWDQLVDLVKAKVLGGVEPVALRNVRNYYKVNDFKPLLAVLFSEVVEGYDFWGYVDNDMLLGDVRHYLTPYFLSRYDIMAAHPHQYTAGHFTLFRNKKIINYLFTMTQSSPRKIFASPDNLAFDEWGGGSSPTKNATTIAYHDTMSGIVDANIELLGLRHSRIWQYVWDSDWYDENKKNEGVTASEVTLTVLDDARQRLVQTCHADLNHHHDCNGQVMFCHLQMTKQTLEHYLQANETLLEKMIRHGSYRLNFRDPPFVLERALPWWQNRMFERLKCLTLQLLVDRHC